MDNGHGRSTHGQSTFKRTRLENRLRAELVPYIIHPVGKGHHGFYRFSQKLVPNERSLM